MASLMTYRSQVCFKCTTRPMRSRISTVRVAAVGWDPEGLLGTPSSGHIQRRMVQKQMETNKDFASAVQSAQSEARRQVLGRRAARSPPDEHEALVEYFLNTVAEDMEYEVARCRMKLDASFFRYLDTCIGALRFAAQPDDDRLAELETLRQYLEEGVAAIDAAAQSTVAAADRMKKLLMSKDKKQTILDMAAAAEIDQALIDLLQQNIIAARNSKQEEAAKFMEKVMVAAAKYVVRPVTKEEEEEPRRRLITS